MMSDKERWEEEKEELQFQLKFAMARETEAGPLLESSAAAKEAAGKEDAEEEITIKEIDSIICERLKDSEADEYLVDGAILSCTSATWKDFDLSDGKVHIEGAEEKEKEGKPTGYLRVWENPMYSNGFHHANVTDTKQGLNIMPFSCNCKEPALSDQEMEISRNKADCQRNGVCKYLMDLEEEWENINFSESLYISKDNEEIPSYKEFEDIDATTSIGAVNVGSLGIRGLQNGKKQGIIMTSVLFCKHGGFIYPVTSGQGYVPGKFHFTLEQLKACGWETATEEDVEKLNAIMQKYGVMSRDSAYMMLATMLAESGCTEKVEGGEALVARMKEIGEDQAWKEYRVNVSNNGNTMGKYNWWNRGAGYMQITGDELQEQFLEYMNDPFDGKDTATYIGNNYPIESAVWYWTKVKMTGEGNLNAYVDANEASKETFLIVQYFVNGFVDGINDTLIYIKTEKEYNIEEGKLISNGKEFPLPNGWENRSLNWKRVEEHMKNEE